MRVRPKFFSRVVAGVINGWKCCSHWRCFKTAEFSKLIQIFFEIEHFFGKNGQNLAIFSPKTENDPPTIKHRRVCKLCTTILWYSAHFTFQAFTRHHSTHDSTNEKGITFIVNRLTFIFNTERSLVNMNLHQKWMKFQLKDYVIMLM